MKKLKKFIPLFLITSCGLNNNVKKTSSQENQEKIKIIVNLEKDDIPKINKPKKNSIIPEPNYNYDKNSLTGEILPFPISKEIANKFPDVKEGISPDDYLSYLLPKPEFTLVYKEDKGLELDDLISMEEKKEFLNEKYEYFLKNINYGNELHTLNRIIFKKTKDSGVYSSGRYSWFNKTITINFNDEDELANQKTIEESLTHEYYHHLVLNSFHSLKPGINNNFYLFIKYLKYLQGDQNLSLDSINMMNFYKAILDNEKEIQLSKEEKTAPPANILKPITLQIIKEMKEFKKTFFNKGNNFISFGSSFLDLNYDYLFENLDYLTSYSEFMVRSLTYQTMSLKDNLENNQINVNNSQTLNNYIQHIALKTNPYYNYSSNRIWPLASQFYLKREKCGLLKVCKIPSLTRDENNLIPIEEPILKTKAELDAQYDLYKKFFLNEVYNVDELLSNSISVVNDDNSYDLILTTNQDVDLILEKMDDVNKYQSYKLRQYSNNIFLKKPFDNSGRKQFVTKSYATKFTNLTPGKYKIKVNHLFLSKGLNINNYLNSQKIHLRYYQGKKKNIVWAQPKFIFRINDSDLINTYLELEVRADIDE